MKQPRTPAIKSDSVQRQASRHAGTTTAPDSPRIQAQGAQIAQLQSAAATDARGTAQLNDGNRKTSGFNRGKSHSTTTPNGKVKSHKPGKGREENKRKSAAKNRKRDRIIASQVANSQAK
jgi:ParB-like chromosome segregation protein Spo0J